MGYFSFKEYTKHTQIEVDLLCVLAQLFTILVLQNNFWFKILSYIVQPPSVLWIFPQILAMYYHPL